MRDLIKLIESKGFTIEDFSNEMNMSVTTFKRRLNCEKEFSLKEIKKMATILKIDVYDVLSSMYEFDEVYVKKVIAKVKK